MALKVYKNFGVDSDFDQEPVKLLEDRADVVKGGGSGPVGACRYICTFVRGTKKE